MTRKTSIAAIIAAIASIGLTASAASAQAAWFNTPRNVARIIVNHYNTSDSEPIIEAACTGVWSAPHVRHAGREYFHRLRCGQWDDLDRHLGANVLVTGANSIRVTQTWCSDVQSRYACP